MGGVACDNVLRVGSNLHIDQMKPRAQCTLFWIGALVTVGWILFVLVTIAHGRDLGQWKDMDPELSKWYSELRQPDNPSASCCGEADAYWADESHVDGLSVFAVITDNRPDEPLLRHHVAPGTRIEVPRHKYKFDKGNPTGHTVIFLGPANQVYCYVQGSGS